MVDTFQQGAATGFWYCKVTARLHVSLQSYASGQSLVFTAAFVMAATEVLARADRAFVEEDFDEALKLYTQVLAWVIRLQLDAAAV
jgi:hypothetical protein